MFLTWAQCESGENDSLVGLELICLMVILRKIFGSVRKPSYVRQ